VLEMMSVMLMLGNVELEHKIVELQVLLQNVLIR